jgi:hypothetical protein
MRVAQRNTLSKCCVRDFAAWNGTPRNTGTRVEQGGTGVEQADVFCDRDCDRGLQRWCVLPRAPLGRRLRAAGSSDLRVVAGTRSQQQAAGLSSIAHEGREEMPNARKGQIPRAVRVGARRESPTKTGGGDRSDRALCRKKFRRNPRACTRPSFGQVPRDRGQIPRARSQAGACDWPSCEIAEI